MKHPTREASILRTTLAALAGFALLVPATWGATEKDLPAGPEKDLLITTCTACHTINRILEAKKTAPQWADTVARMNAKGGIDASGDDLDVITAYLQKNLSAK